MKINYKDADGKNIDIEVSEEVGTFYLESIEAEKKNDRKNSRPDRHSQLSTFAGQRKQVITGSDSLIDLRDLFKIKKLSQLRLPQQDDFQ